MTAIAMTMPGRRIGAKLGSAFAGIGWAIVSTGRLAARTWVAAPAIIGIAVLPELAQHAAEIHLGMFESKEAFRAAAEDPLRWTFAYPKVAGFVIAILMTARFWALGSVRGALLIAPGTLLRLAVAIALTLAAEQPFTWLKEASATAAVDGLLTVASALVQAGLLVYLVGALVEDRSNGLRRSFTDRWPTALLITLLAAIALVPTQALHSANHSAAFGQPASLVWALMIFDSLWVGLMAASIGSALFVGYRAGPTWRGWTEKPARRWRAGPAPAAAVPADLTRER